MLSLSTRTIALRLAANRTAISPYCSVVPIRRSLLDANSLVTALPYVPSGLRGYADLTDVPSETATFPAEVKKPKRAVREKKKEETAASASKTARSEAAALKREEKEKAAALKAKEKAEKEKKKAAALKEKAKAAAEKEKKKAAALKEKEKAAAEKEKIKALKQNVKPWDAFDEDGKKLPFPTASKPRRPSAFLLYATATFPKLSNDPEFMSKLGNPSGKDRATRISCAIGESWKALSETERQKYEEMYRVHLAAYKDNLARWESSLTQQDRRRIDSYNRYIRAHPEVKKRRVKLPKEEGKPRHPPSGFMRFMKEYYQEHPDSPLSFGDRAKEIGEVWTKMSSSEREPYEDAYKREHVVFKKAMEEWNKEHGDL